MAQPAFAQEYTVDEGTLQSTSGGVIDPVSIVISGGGFEPGARVRITGGRSRTSVG